MSSYDKLIKQATKAKPDAPKAKYIDPIIASSFSQDGSLQEICRSLSQRLQDSSSLVVFRSLIVVHTLIRNGGVNNVLTHLSSGQGNLRLRAVVQGGSWQGYDAPRLLSPYATYLEERIKAFRELRHDVIRASEGQSRSNSRGGDRSEGAESGQRLRKMTVEKGLLREVSVCQKVCSRLLDVCFSYFSDNVYDDLSLTAFRMSLKDLLAIYAAINEGVINVLEHYFEMSKVDATNALDTYKRFCTHTEKIVAYLASARKLSSSLSMTIPNLRHAPVSLAGALREYLDDPNFEKNRQEYKENKRIVDGGGKPAKKAGESTSSSGGVPASSSKKSITIKEPTAEEKTKPAKPVTENQALQDFFESIETNQMSMFGANAQQQGFIMPQATGFQPQMAFMQPQMTGYNPFFGQQPAAPAFMQQPQMQPQITGFAPGGFLQPQMTGAMANPFRQSMFPQQSPFGQVPMQSNGGAQQPMQANGSTSHNGPAPSTSPAPMLSRSPPPSASAAAHTSTSGANQPARSASVPLTAQKTGSRNPFAPPPGSSPPPLPKSPSAKGPTLFELAYGGGGVQGPTSGGGGSYGLGANAWNGNGQTSQPATMQNPALVPQKTGLIGNIASEFVVGGGLNGATSPGAATPAATENAAGVAGPQATTMTSANDLSNGFSGLSLSAFATPSGNNGPPTGISNPTGNALQPQPTGFGGSLVMPFKPESSFGQSLASGTSSPAPIPANMTGNPFARLAAATPPITAAAPQQQPSAPSAPSPFAQNGFASNNSASSPGSAFAQNTSPFGASPFLTTNTQPNTGTTPLAAQPTGFAGSTVKPFQPSSAFGTVAFGNGMVQTPQPQQQQQNPTQQQPQNIATGSLF